MDQQTEKLFDDNHDLIIEEACRRFNLDRTTVKKLGSFESAVYEISDGHSPRILKASDDRHRRADAIRAELEWVNYLADGGVPVCRAILSERGQMVETLALPDNGAELALVLFEKARGERLTSATCDDKMIQTWGECIGRMHRLTKSFRPSGMRRHHWHEDRDLIPPQVIIENEPEVVEKFEGLLKKLKLLPVEKDSYGLVHIDMHHGNFFVEDGRLMVFDTDDCHYDYFAADIAMPLYYYYRDKKLGERSVEKARWFFGNLLEGYGRHNQLDRKWLGRVPDFLKLRQMLLYMIVTSENLVERDPFFKDFIADFYHAIVNDIPVIEMEFGGE